MADIPYAVITYLLNFIIEERSLAYLLVKKDGCLLAWGGKLAEYGITNLRQGMQVCEQVFFLEGLLPLDDSSIFLPLINLEQGICADIHIFSSDDGDWIVLLDSILDGEHIAGMQQATNDFCLLQEISTKLVNHQPQE